MHGGKTPNGIASPNWKTGRWATHIRHQKLRGFFYAALSDAGLLKMQQDIAFVDGLISLRMSELPAAKPVTEAQERRMLNLLDAKRRMLNDLARMERDLQLWVHYAKHRRVLDAMVALLHKRMVLADGSPDMAALREVNEQVRLILAESNVIEGEVIEDDEPEGGNDDGSGGPGR